MMYVMSRFGQFQKRSRKFHAKTTTRERSFSAYVISHSTCLHKAVCIRNQTGLMFQQTAQNAKANVLEAENKDKQLLGASTLRLHENKNLIRKLNTEKGV